jgi:hypothetical protein
VNLDKLEQSVLDIERRRITKEEGQKAQKAMEALDVGKSSSAKPSVAKSEDIDFLVRLLYSEIQVQTDESTF